jgi:hypothetical protein
MLLALTFHLTVALIPWQTADQVKDLFNSAIINSDGQKLHAAFSEEELNGATPKACSLFLELVTKPLISKIGTYDQFRTFQSILDPRSPMSIKFRPTGGANIHITENRAYAFEPVVITTKSGHKSSTGFADLAFWAAHNDKTTKAASGSLNRAIAAHRMFETWVPQFTKMGIKGSIDPETKKYMTWVQVLDSSQKEITKMRSGGI